MWGISYPGFYVARRHDRRAPGAEGRVAAGAGHRLLHGRRLVPQRRVHAGRTTSASTRASPRAARAAPPQAAARRSTTARRTATTSTCRWARSAERERAATAWRENPYWNDQPRRTRPTTTFWKARAHLAALQGHHAGGADRRRLVRRRGSRRAAAHATRRIEQTRARHDQPPRDGPVDARRLVARRRRHGRQRSTSAPRPSAFYREHIEFPFFTQHLKGRAGEPVPEATMFETGTNEWRTLDDVAAARPRTPQTLYLRRRRHARADRAGATAEALRRVRQRSEQAGAVRGPRRRSACTRDYMTEDQRFAAHAARRARLPDAAARRRPDHRRARSTSTLHVSTTGTDADFVVKLIDVYPERLPDARWSPQPEPANRVRMGGYQQLVRGEPFRGKFRNSFEKPEPFVPGQPATHRTSTLPDVAPHVPPRPPAHGAGAELVVPADRSQPADVHGHPEERGPRTSESPPSGSTAVKARASAITLPVERR